MRLAIVEDHRAIAEALAALLGATPEIAVVGVATDAAAAALVIGSQHPDVVLCDVMLGGLDTGLDLLHEYGRESRFLMYSEFDYPSHHARAIEDGAAGFISKSVDAASIVAALREVAAGGTWFPPEVVASARRAARPPTRRERELLLLLADGAPNEEIARRLGIGLRTVEGMFRRLFDRYTLDNRTQLARLAASEGWLCSNGSLRSANPPATKAALATPVARTPGPMVARRAGR